MKLNKRLLIAIFFLAVNSSAAFATVLMKATALKGIDYPNILTGSYQSSITRPAQMLGFPIGKKTATPEQINALVALWAQQSDRANIVEYARSYENRPLHYLVISSAKNLQNLATIKANIQQLSHPDPLSKTQISDLIAQTPATAWMAYSIHGNETSGADAALALIYHLLASTEADITGLLDDMVILVDPMMNPDGRARFAKNLQEHRGAAPNIDTQSLLHTGVWPFGRTNHYLFDLNRDFYFAVNPESRGRIQAINQWYPQLMIDAHEMGDLDSFLFAPAREPVNQHLPGSNRHWGKVFADEQARAFDRKVWPYYTGEWFENLYPGYSNYAEYRGSLHILYEQARTAEDGIRLENGNIRSYQEAVDHQFVSSLTNLKTLQQHSKAIYQDFVKNRLANSAATGPYANQSFVILPSKNTSRLTKLLDILALQNIDYFINDHVITVKKAKNHLGQLLDKVTIEPGAIIIPNRQYEAPLIAAIMEFDVTIKASVLLEERQKTLRDGSSVMYDNTAWNLSMLYGLPALEVPQHFNQHRQNVAVAPLTGIVPIAHAIAYLVDGATDASVAFAARLLEQQVQVRVLDKAGVFNGLHFSRGSVVVYQYDNAHNADQLEQLIQTTAIDTRVQVNAINQGLGEDDLPDIGGENFKLLRKPNIAIVSQNGIDPGDYGSMWHLIDTELGIRHSHLYHELLSDMDLRLYNVLIIPSRYYGELSGENIKTLDRWVKNGGSLIVNGNSAAQLAAAQLADQQNFSKVRLLDDTFTSAANYNIALYQEWLAAQDSISNHEHISAHQVPDSIWFPWGDEESLKPMDDKQLKTWNDWTSAFMPSGAILATRTDQQHWLSYGVDRQLPVLTSNAPLFMTKRDAEAVVRYGTLVNNPTAKEKMLGWSTIPKGQDLYLRMSGLLWPEAAQRISNAAYLTRETKGNGQIIMFADSPNFRGATKGTARLLLNAMVYGPGLGTTPVINL